MERIDTIQRIERDFEEGAGPFSDVTFPEERLLRTIATDDDGEVWSFSMEDKMCLLSAFSMLDYNRDANQLVDNLIELHEKRPKWFDPMACPDGTVGVSHVFEKIGFRYPNRDANAWVKNQRIVRHQYHGKWAELLMETGLDAERLVERLESDGFNCLKGVKIAPMYARFTSEYVVELDNLWELDIPVDRHVRKLSSDLFERFDGDTTTDDEIREIWRLYGVRENVNRHVVDGALWQIGNNWSEWGEDYWNKVTA